jgi:hypothetical protein
MKKERKKLSLDDLEIESFETKVAAVVTGASHQGSCTTTCNWSILSCQHSSCAAGGPC